MKTPAPVARRYLVGVFDIVGQSNVFQSFADTGADPAADPALAAAFKETLGFTHWFRTAFQKTFDETPFKKNPIAPYDRDLHEIEKLISEKDVKIQTFADLIVPYTALPDTGHHLRALSAIYRMLYTAGTLVAISLANGHAVRGGIEADAAMERAPGDLYGPALNESLRLEMRDADYPRIRIGRGLHAYLKRLSQDPEKSVFGTHVRDLAAQCLRLSFQDTDTQPALDYLHAELRSASLDDPTLIQARTFVAQSLAHWQAAGHAPLTERYTRLNRYWQRFIPRPPR